MPHNTFYSTDLGAGQISDTPGQLVAVLDQCLVNGGPTFSVTSVTRSGTLATATTVAHGLSPGGVYPVDRRLTIAGANEADYNGTFLCSITSNTTFTYTVANAPATPASGTVLASVAPLGWTIAFTATNKRSYLQGAGSNGFYLDVDDTNAAYSLVRGYEIMTAVGTGSNPFPTVAQQPLASYCWHKVVGNAGNRLWVLSGNSKTINFFINAHLGAFSINNPVIYQFGDQLTEVSGDAYNTGISASISTGASLAAPGASFGYSAIDTSFTGRYMARLSTGVGSSIAVGMHADSAKNSSGVPGAGSMTYPAQNGGLYISPIVTHHNSSPRATQPGIYDICHSRPLSNFDYFSGNGAYAGRQFQCVHVFSNNAGGCVAIEVTPW